MNRQREDPEKKKLKPSYMKTCTGYRTDSERHREARMKVPPERRRQIALLGGLAFALKHRPKDFINLVINFLESHSYKVIRPNNAEDNL